MEPVDSEPNGKTLVLPEAMRAELKEPLGVLLEGDPAECTRSLILLLRERRPTMVATVGDFVSRNVLGSSIEPDIIVVDRRVMRVDVELLDLGDRVRLHARNPPGTIDSDAWAAIGEAVRLKNRAAVIVEGEEDLLVLPLISLMPIDSVIVYGQPGRGMVIVSVDEKRKGWAEGFMRLMEES